ncbi:hypothetical protein [Methyloferula stellata]|uniref:hypothetical protein n=1 Tax=Methyloferula stellata TaxID=876270 RepID=UPI00036FDAA5|nr:hypothetical protein [Methyloferula stellata]
MSETPFDQIRIKQAKQRRKQKESLLIIAGAIVVGICLGIGSVVLIVRDGGCGMPFFNCDTIESTDADGGL